MMEVFDYIGEVLRLIKDEKQKAMSHLRVELFMAAAESINPEVALLPFPHCFYDTVRKQKRWNDLLDLNKDIPSLESLDFVAEKVPEKAWELLYWILTNPLTIQHVETSDETLAAWTQETGLNLDCLSKPSRRVYLFSVVNPNLNDEFVKGKEEYGTMFAFHGSKFQNFHSIVHRGLLSALNVRSAHGHGSYLSNSFDLSFSYTDWKRSWANSSLGESVKCMAICEVVKYPEMKISGSGSAQSVAAPSNRPATYIYVVDKDEFIQLSHLILLTNVDKNPPIDVPRPTLRSQGLVRQASGAQPGTSKSNTSKS